VNNYTKKKRHNFLGKVVICLVAASFLCQNIVFATPNQLINSTRNEITKRTLQPPSKIDEKEEQELFLNLAKMTELLKTISHLLLSAYTKAIETDEISDEDLDKVDKAVADSEFEIKVLLNRSVALEDFNTREKSDFIAVPLKIKGKHYVLIIRLDISNITENWEKFEKETKVALKEVIELAIDERKYLVSLHSVDEGEDLLALGNLWRKSVNADPVTAKILEEAKRELVKSGKGCIIKRDGFKSISIFLVMLLALGGIVSSVVAMPDSIDIGPPIDAEVASIGVLADVQQSKTPVMVENILLNIAMEGPIQALNNKNEYVHHITVAGIVKIGTSATEPMIDVLSNSNGTRSPFQRESAAEILGKLKDRRAVKPLIDIAKDPAEDEYFRITVVEALGELGDQRAIKSLSDIVNSDENLNMREFAIEALGKIGDKSVVKLLFDALEKDEQKDTLEATAAALGELKAQNAAKPLLKYLYDEDGAVWGVIVRALGDIGNRNEEIIAAITKVLKNDEEEEYVLNDAAMALVKLGVKTEKAKTLILRIASNVEEEYDDDIRITSIALLGKIVDADVTKSLTDILNNPNESQAVREAAQKTLGNDMETLERAISARGLTSRNLVLAGMEEAEPKEDIIAKMESGYLQKDCGAKEIKGFRLQSKKGHIIADSSVIVDPKLVLGIEHVDKSVRDLLTPKVIKEFINVNKLPDGMTVGKIISEIKAILAGANVKTDEGDRPLAIRYLKGYTVGKKVISHAGVKYGCVYLPSDMVRNSNPKIVARIELHELLHHILDDPNHVIIKGEMKSERDAVLSDIVTLSKEAQEIREEIANIKALRDFEAKEKGFVTINKTITDMREATKAQNPSMICVTVDPDNMIGCEDEIKAISAKKRNAKVMLVGKKGYVWTEDQRNKLMGKFTDILVGYITEEELTEMKKMPEIGTYGKALVAYANKKVYNGNPVFKEVDLAFIDSVYEQNQLKEVIAGIKNVIPVIKAKIKTIKGKEDVEGNQAYRDIGTLIDVAELAIMAHRIAVENGLDFSSITFEQLAKGLGGDLATEFLSALETLGIKPTDNVAVGLISVPPIETMPKGLQQNVNSLRVMLIAA